MRCKAKQIKAKLSKAKKKQSKAKKIKAKKSKAKKSKDKQRKAKKSKEKQRKGKENGWYYYWRLFHFGGSRSPPVGFPKGRRGSRSCEFLEINAYRPLSKRSVPKRNQSDPENHQRDEI